MLALIKRIPGSVYLEAVGLGNVFGFQSGAGYALRMLNHYWIVPDVPAGAATESCIEDKNRRILRQALLLFGLWFGLLLGLQFYITPRGSSSQLFPHGPLVFLCLLLMLVGDASMICGHVATRLHRSRQLLRGKARLLLQTCPIGSPQRLRQAELGTAKAEEYWKEEKFSEQWRDVWEWYRMVRREAEVLPPSVRMRPGRRVGAIVAQVVAAVFAAVLISFLGVLLCMTFVPDASSREMWPLAISLFVPSLFAPNVLWKLSKRLRARAR